MSSLLLNVTPVRISFYKHLAEKYGMCLSKAHIYAKFSQRLVLSIGQVLDVTLCFDCTPCWPANTSNDIDNVPRVEDHEIVDQLCDSETPIKVCRVSISFRELTLVS